ncbi:UNVERIFIED_CONTAM: hypothetical protein NCL1_33321 [Trichonephila clavipes]
MGDNFQAFLLKGGETLLHLSSFCCIRAGRCIDTSVNTGVNTTSKNRCFISIQKDASLNQCSHKYHFDVAIHRRFDVELSFILM